MTRNNRKQKMLSIFFIVIMTTIIFLVGCTEQNTENGTSETTLGLISAKDAWDKVRPSVEAWDPGYTIARIQHFGTSHWSENAKETSWEFYVESSDGSTSTTFTYPVQNSVSKDSDVPFGTGRNTFQASNWVIDSTEAASIAIKEIKDQKVSDFNGGLKAIIYADKDGAPYWEIEYSTRQKNGKMDLDIPLKYGTVEINAKTREIIDITGS